VLAVARRVLERGEDGVFLRLGDDALLHEAVEKVLELVRVLAVLREVLGVRRDERGCGRGGVRCECGEGDGPEKTEAGDAGPDRETYLAVDEAHLIPTSWVGSHLVYLPAHRIIDAAKFAIPEKAETRSIPYGASTARAGYPAILRDGVRTIFVRSARIGRDKVYGYPDDAKRYALFCRAVLADLVDRPPDVVHAHDWHAALLVPMVDRAKQLRGSGTAFTIHNLAYQG